MKSVMFVAALLSTSAWAGAPMSATSAAGVYRITVGTFQVTALSDGTVTLPLDQILNHIQPDTLNSVLAGEHLTSHVETSINAFLINTGSKLVLVDTGSGEEFRASPGAHAGRLQASLKNAGYRPDQVDAVLLTHLHGDHTGGLVLNGKVMFPNATVYLSRREADFWLNRDNIKYAEGQKQVFDSAAQVLGLYSAAKHLQTFDGATEIMPGIRSMPAYGHTPGHSFYAVESGAQKLLLVGDLVHAAAVQLPYPAATVSFDSEQPEAAGLRGETFAEAAKQGYLIGAAHIAFPGLGRVLADGTAYRWAPVNYSAW